MKLKKIIIILVFLFIIIGVSLHFYYDNQNSRISFGSSTVNIPSNFSIVKNGTDEIILNNQGSTYNLKVYENKTIDKLIEDYNKSKNDSNQKILINRSSVSQFEIIKTYLYEDKLSFINYWFEKNGNQYRYIANVTNKSDMEIHKIEYNLELLINNTN